MHIIPFTPSDLVPIEAAVDAVVATARLDVVGGLRALAALLRALERAPMLLTPASGACVAQACATIAVLEERAGGAALNVACAVARLDHLWRTVPTPTAHRASWLALAWGAVGAV